MAACSCGEGWDGEDGGSGKGEERESGSCDSWLVRNGRGMGKGRTRDGSRGGWRGTQKGGTVDSVTVEEGGCQRKRAAPKVF